MRPRQLVLSPRLSVKQAKSIECLKLNSYKIDTKSLQQKEKQIQVLKAELQTQLNQLKSSSSIYQQELKHLRDEKNELKDKIKQLQTELKQFKSQKKAKQIDLNVSQINGLKDKINDVEEKLEKMKKELHQEKNVVRELQEYKNMYEIQVENKTNIVNFYQNKLALFQKDKNTLISKYEQRISHLGSVLENNETTTIQPHTNISHIPITTNKNSIKGSSNFSSQRSPKDNQGPAQLKINHSKDIQIIGTLQKRKNLGKQSPINQSTQFQQVSIPLGFLTSQTNKDSKQEKKNNKNCKNNTNQVSVFSSTFTNNNYHQISRNEKSNDSQKKNTSASTNKTLRNSNTFMKLIRQVVNNLRRNNIKSDNLKSLQSVKNFLTIPNPSLTQVTQMLNSFPFGRLEMQESQIEDSVQRMKSHLEKKYSLWSGNLFIELLIDKIEDFEIACEVNSQDEGEIVAGLSSNEDYDE